MGTKPNKEVTALKRQVIQRLVKKEAILWPREMKLVNTLFTQYEDIEFWKHFKLEFQLNSLAWFISEDGKKRISDAYKIFKYVAPQQEKIVVGTVKCGEDAVVKRKPTNLHEFLK